MLLIAIIHYRILCADQSTANLNCKFIYKLVIQSVIYDVLFFFQPSFGYIINSPEKREPFALIRPSDFSSRGSSVRSETVQLSDADETMNPGMILSFLQCPLESGLGLRLYGKC